MKKMFGNFKKGINDFRRKLNDKLDLTDFFALGGLYMIFHGLNLWKTHVAWTVVGLIVFILSVSYGSKN